MDRNGLNFASPVRSISICYYRLRFVTIGFAKGIRALLRQVFLRFVTIARSSREGVSTRESTLGTARPL